MLAALTCSVALAVPAKRMSTTITQSDGTKITVTMKGDEWHHTPVTSDGKPVAISANGDVFYRTSNGVSSVRAHEVSERAAAEINFLSANESEMTVTALTSKSRKFAAGQKARRKVGATQVPQSGSPRIPILLVEFSDKKMSNSKETFVSQYTSGSKSAFQYFKDQSNGKFTPQYDVYGIYPLTSSRETYGANDSDGNDVGVAKMVGDAIAKAGSDVDWSLYDNDGDGMADVCIVVYAGVGEAQAWSTVPNSVWPCQWELSDAVQYGDGSGAVTRNGVTIDKFAVFNEINGKNDSSTQIDGVGTFCHEFSHCLGLPDFYETTYANDYYGMGDWSLMNTGSYNDDGYTPIGYGAYEKDFMGWISLQTPVQGTQYTLPVWNQKQESTDVAYKVTSPLNSNEYYVLENRAQQGWDLYIPDEGMMVTHVTYMASRWEANTVNNQAVQLFTIIPADNSLSEDDESGDLYGETNHALTDTSTPAAKLNMKASGSLATTTGGAGLMGQPLTEIQLNSDKTVSFWYMKGAEPHFAPVLNEASNVQDNQFTASWTDETESQYVTDYELQVNIKSGGSAGAAELVAEEDMSAGTTSWTLSSSGTYADTDNGGLRLGTSKANGSVTSPTVNLSKNVATVVVNCMNYGTDSDVPMKVSVLNASGTELASESVTLNNSSMTDATVVLNGTFGTDCQVKIETTTTRKRVVISHVSIYNGDASSAGAPARASETGDSRTRTITGITGKTYTVTGLNQGETYSFKVRANYSDLTTSAWTAAKTVTLTGEKVLNPYIVADEAVALGTVNVGEQATAELNVLAEELKGDVTLTLNDPNNVFALSSNTIAKAAAEEGAAVTVTFTPVAAQAYEATVTVSSQDADDVTVTLTGAGALVKVVPELLDATADNIGSTLFTARWNEVANAKSYTLFVNQKATASVTELLSEDFSTGETSWTTGGFTEFGDSEIRLGSGSQNGSLTSPTIDLTDYDGKVTVEFTGRYYGSDNSSLKVTVGGATQTVALSSESDTYKVVLDATAGETNVVLSTTATKKRIYLSSVKVYGGDASDAASAARKAEETGDATQRTITGITGGSYTVQNLLAGSTYEYMVKAVYTDDTESEFSASKTVTLLESGDPVPEIITNEETVNFETVFTGGRYDSSITISAANLTEGITVTLTSPEQVSAFTVSQDSFTLEELENGEVSLGVTFAPVTAGTYNATVTLSSSGAASVTVPLTGVAELEKLVPELAAEATGVDHTTFTATWNEVPNAESYTLMVNNTATPEASCELLLDEDLSESTTTWTATNTYTDEAGYLRLGAGKNIGSIESPTIDLTDYNGVVTVIVTGKYYASDNATMRVTVGDASEDVALTDEDATYAVVLNADAGETTVKISGIANKKRLLLSSVLVYGGDASALVNDEAGAPAKAVAESGDENSRVITGINANSYKVENLATDGTFRYMVKAVYTDGTESDWSEAKTVTLGEPAWQLGDVNHSGNVDVADVVALANHVMGESQDVFFIEQANVNQDEDGTVDIADVVALSTIVMGN